MVDFGVVFGFGFELDWIGWGACGRCEDRERNENEKENSSRWKFCLSWGIYLSFIPSLFFG